MTSPIGKVARHCLHTAATGLLCLFVAGAGLAEEGIGGTGKPQWEGSGMGGTGSPLSQHESEGIGGTGTPAPHSESGGIGGTGIPLAAAEGSGIGGTGIVGVITAFGSIWVNGVEVHYPTDAVVNTPAGPRDTDALALGQFVMVSSDRRGNQAVARDIQLLPVVAGPVAATNPSGGRFSVAGQTVLVTSTAGQHAPAVGDWVSVYGMRRADGVVMATAITPHPAGQVIVYGAAASGPAEGTLHIQDLPIVLPPGSHAAPGVPLLVTGTLRDGMLLALQIRSNPIGAVAEHNRSLSIQGYVQTTDAGQVTVDHQAIRLPDTEQPTPDVDQLVLIEAHRDDDGSFVADRIDALSLAELGHDGAEVAGMRGEFTAHPVRAEPPDAGETEVQPTELETPETETPEVETPEVETPEVETPEVETPEVETPEVEAPEVEAPEVESPEVPIPEMETPEVQIPEVETPEAQIPEVEAPEVQVPEVQAPET